MERIKEVIISNTPPTLTKVGWLLPLDDGTFKLKFFGPKGWIDATSGVQGPKGDKGDKGDTGAQGPAGQNGVAGPSGADGKSVKAIALTTNAEGAVTGGTATLSDDSTIQITVTVTQA